MRLTISLEKGIIVVVPKSMSQRRVDKLVSEFVKKKQAWLNEAYEKLLARKTISPGLDQCQLPEKIELLALGQVFSISYQPHTEVDNFLRRANESKDSLYKAEGFTLHQVDDFKLEIRGDLSNKKRVFELLEVFFKDYARFYLKQRLDQLSKEFNLPYNRVTIRAQKTRWGSCSSKKNINLNYRLLFIEDKLLDYIILHELVHTVHMNHSKAFWLYFESLMQDARVRDKKVNQMSKKLPCWIFHFLE
ncbi:MAG: M48 family metallopeptidase [Gammaproteobacteria bacterium]|nr:M48 family metallopeptidase [Gammaproteobacteria bacterium]